MSPLIQYESVGKEKGMKESIPWISTVLVVFSRYQESKEKLKNKLSSSRYLYTKRHGVF